MTLCAAAFSALCLLAPAALSALTLEEAQKEMAAANPQAAAATRELNAAAFRLSAANAALYPALSGDASYTRHGNSVSDPYNSYAYGLSAWQPLFYPSLSAVERSAAAAEASARAARLAVLSNLSYALRLAFADSVNASEALKLSEETLRRRSENLELIRLKYQAGRENKAALLETEAALKTARWQHQRHINDLRLQARKLNRLLGRRASSPTPELTPPQAPEPPEDFSAVEPLLKNHPSLLSARAAEAAAKAAVSSARSSGLPQASANAAYRWSGSAWPESPNSWSLGASLSVPLFAWGKFSSGSSAAEANLAAAGLSLKDAEEEVLVGAEDAFLSWREAASWLDAARTSLEAAEARAWLVRKQYLAGQSSYFEWRSVEEQYVGARSQLLSAGRALELAYAAYLKAIGA